MDPQIRNFKDFLQLYNKITELCFKSCVDNFLSRSIAVEESSCVDKCVQKFAKVNQRIMDVYVDVQTEINKRRVAELEAQAASVAPVDANPVVTTNITSPSLEESTIINSTSKTALDDKIIKVDSINNNNQSISNPEVETRSR